MQIGNFAPNWTLLLNSIDKSKESAQPANTFATSSSSDCPADPAAPAQILPAQSAPISFETFLALQSQAPETDALTSAKSSAATEKFLAEMHKSPMQRMREQILDSLGLSEDALARMSPEERKAAEDKIKQMIEQKLREAMGADNHAPDGEQTNVAFLAAL